MAPNASALCPIWRTRNVSSAIRVKKPATIRWKTIVSVRSSTRINRERVSYRGGNRKTAEKMLPCNWIWRPNSISLIWSSRSLHSDRPLCLSNDRMILVKHGMCTDTLRTIVRNPFRVCPNPHTIQPMWCARSVIQRWNHRRTVNWFSVCWNTRKTLRIRMPNTFRIC